MPNTESVITRDITRPFAPTIVGSIEIPAVRPSGIYDIHVSGNYAYVTHNRDGLSVVDVSVPSAPKIVGKVSNILIPDDKGGGIYVRDVYVSGNYAYVSNSSSGLQVVDISKPSTPTIVGNVQSMYADKVYVNSNYAYVTDGFYVVDISKPSAPTIVSNLNIPDRAIYDVYISGNYAYLGNYSPHFNVPLGLLVVDISNLSAPTIVTNINLGYLSSYTYVGGKYVYAIDKNGLQVLDISGFEALK